ncbi:hypothetical protein VTN77DRAFT_93 [Rasamsonia byssochlamydoides]|uniref:uncharacterized protein n=1 Tax=Rasamsonia byssochlamydoides TaxID=89139 RepID=UPI003743F3E1
MEERPTHPSLPSRIAALVHAHFDALPARCKPMTREDGSREWIPMSGIVVVKGENTPSETLTCVAVTTGARCLPSSHIPRCRGLVLHDCHAEILALRAFNYWVLNECHSVILREQQEKSSRSSPFVRRRSGQTCPHESHSWPPFEICPDIRIYMYCTCAPCGDASMELCMAAQEDPTPWAVTPKPELTTVEEGMTSATQNLLDGRAHFSILGVVRRKPARADAEATLSKSCSDKLALRQVTSLLSYPASLLVAPTENAYLAGLILPEEEISRVACDRAFGAGPTGRMRKLAGRWWRERPDEKYGYRFRPFEVLSVPTKTVEALWPYGKPKSDIPGASTKGRKKNSNKPSNISAVWVTAPSSAAAPFQVRSSSENETTKHKLRSATTTGIVETIINGVKQGNQVASVTARGASVLCRAKMWSFLREIIKTASSSAAADDNVIADDKEDPSTILTANEKHTFTLPWRAILEAKSYGQFKRPEESPEDSCPSIPTPLKPQLSTQLKLRRLAMQDAKRVLQPWIPNRGDEDWNVLEVLVAEPKDKNRNKSTSTSANRNSDSDRDMDRKVMEMGMNS